MPSSDIPLNIKARVETAFATMAAKLSLAIPAFWCEECYEMIRTPFQFFTSPSPKTNHGGLILAVLRSLGLDLETATYEDTEKLAN
ncbi:hypothetical protein FRB96_008656 [Tulasnella sp. 330]|nr:hypothetical protein FRB96_008656 [Tulasnella sp. 330]